MLGWVALLDIASPLILRCAELMRRVYKLEVLRCPWCHGQRKLLTFITNPDVIRKVLAWLRLPLDPPPLVQARDSPDVIPAW